jgi:hypothetical protein
VSASPFGSHEALTIPLQVTLCVPYPIVLNIYGDGHLDQPVSRLAWFFKFYAFAIP